MGELGYGTREPLVNKLKQLVNDIQSIYEEFLDAETLYQQGKISDKEFFKKMGSFLKAFSSMGFLTVKAVVEINNALGKGDKTKPEAVTMPSPTYRPDSMGGISMPQYSPIKEEKETDVKTCSKCGSNITSKAKFCPKCGAKQ